MTDDEIKKFINEKYELINNNFISRFQTLFTQLNNALVDIDYIKSKEILNKCESVINKIDEWNDEFDINDIRELVHLHKKLQNYFNDRCDD